MPLSQKLKSKSKNAKLNIKGIVPSGITSRMIDNITGSAGIAISQDTLDNEIPGIAGCVVYPTHGVVVVVPGRNDGYSYTVTTCCDMNELSFLEESDPGD